MCTRRTEFLLLDYWFFTLQLLISFVLSILEIHTRTQFKTSYDNTEFIFESNGAISFPVLLEIVMPTQQQKALYCTHSLAIGIERKHLLLDISRCVGCTWLSWHFLVWQTIYGMNNDGRLYGLGKHKEEHNTSSSSSS